MAESGDKAGRHGKTDRRKLIVAGLVVLLTIAATAIGITLNKTLNVQQRQDRQEERLEGPYVDCHLKTDPDEARAEQVCRERGCVWQPGANGGNRPKCLFPSGHGYRMVGEKQTTPIGFKVTLQRVESPHIYGPPFENLTVSVEFHTDYRLRIKIYPESTERFEIPEEALNISLPQGQTTTSASRLYDVTFDSDPIFGIKVTRNSTNATIFHTNVPGFVYTPQFIQISTRLHNSYIYGFGEHRHESFRHDMNWRTWSIFTRDAGPDNNWNLYGAHPVYMNVEDDGKANMVFLKNSNAMEIVLQPDPTPALTFRTIGGVLDFYIFLGSSPSNAVAHYTEAIGRPVLPPYWSLGFQLSRWGYIDIDDMRAVIQRNRAAGIPYEVQWADIDSLFKKYIFTYDRTNWTGMPELVNDLHSHNQYFVIIVDPGVGADHAIIEEAKINSNGYSMFQDGEDAGIFVKNASGQTLIGEVWPGLTAYPDFTNISVMTWYEKYVRFYREREGITVDALWIDMNEPSSFVPGSITGCENTTWDYPPYVPNILGAGDEGKMFEKTLCMTSQHAWGRHYDVHSLYAHAMAMRTNRVLKNIFPGKRPWTMTRSSFAGTGHYATKWTGDNQSRWPAMHWSIIAIMEFSMFGFAMNGADICGFWYEPTYEMCIRWHQLGAFYPFARNHNGRGDDPVIFKHQDPAAFGQEFVDIVKQPLLTRYKFLPYLYSLLFRAHLHGDTVLRPLMFEFPTDLIAREVDRQFLLGPALLISPVLEENTTNVRAYFPRSRWYEYLTGEEVTPTGEFLTLYTPLDKFNLHLRGGHVIPWQRASLTTNESRQNDMGLLVSLDEHGWASGELYWDDGVSEVNETSYSLLSFKVKQVGLLLIELEKLSTPPPQNLILDVVEIYGLETLPSQVTVDGVELAQDKVFYINNKVQLTDLNIPVFSRHNITWVVY